MIWERATMANHYKLKQVLITIINKKIGPTDHINIEDSVRKGRPLSGLKFVLLIDELDVELRTKDFGIEDNFVLIISLLLKDDIGLLPGTEIELQNTLVITIIFLNEWHLKINPIKSGILIFNKQINKQTLNQYKFKRGTENLKVEGHK